MMPKHKKQDWLFIVEVEADSREAAEERLLTGEAIESVLPVDEGENE